MDEREFQRRTKQLALDVMRMVEHLPPGRTADTIARQILRSGTSVGANCRASCRARSLPEIVAKLSIAEEECDETIYWLELLSESGIMAPAEASVLISSGREILAMTVASKKTLKARMNYKGFADEPRGPEL